METGLDMIYIYVNVFFSRVLSVMVTLSRSDECWQTKRARGGGGIVVAICNVYVMTK